MNLLVPFHYIPVQNPHLSSNMMFFDCWFFSFLGSYSCSFGAFHTGLILCIDPFIVYFVHVQSISNSFSIIFFSMPLQHILKMSINSYPAPWALHQYWITKVAIFYWIYYPFLFDTMDLKYCKSIRDLTSYKVPPVLINSLLVLRAFFLVCPLFF